MRMSHFDDHPLEFFCSGKFSDDQKSGTIVVNASKGEESTVSPTIYKSELRNVAAPDLDGHAVVDSPGNRGVDVKCENAATRSTSVFGAAKNVSSDSISTKLWLNETPDAPMEKSGGASDVCLASIRRMRASACISV